jgi:hypothetical protein
MGFLALRTIRFAGLRTIAGVTRDSTGAILAGCTVNLFLTSGNTFVSSTVSDANGNFAFYVSSPIPQYFLVGYLAGSPDVEGTTVNTLTAA